MYFTVKEDLARLTAVRDQVDRKMHQALKSAVSRKTDADNTKHQDQPDSQQTNLTNEESTEEKAQQSESQKNDDVNENASAETVET